MTDTALTTDAAIAKLVSKTESVKLPQGLIEKLDDIFEGIVVLFGSYAKGVQKDDSDLDLFIVGKHDEKKIKEAGHKYGIEINIKSYPTNIFEKEINQDILLKMDQIKWCLSQKKGIETVQLSDNLREAYLRKAEEALEVLRATTIRRRLK